MDILDIFGHFYLNHISAPYGAIFLFLVINSYFFLFFRGTNSYFPIFLTIPITWRPEIAVGAVASVRDKTIWLCVSVHVWILSYLYGDL